MNAGKRAAWVAAVVLLGLVGCAPKAVQPKGPRPPSLPEKIKFYDKPPYRYEKLGVVSVQAGGDVRWDEQGNADAGFDRLLRQAAQLGANGLLMKVDPGLSDGRLLAGYHGFYHKIPYKNTTPRTVLAEAIYVLDQ